MHAGLAIPGLLGPQILFHSAAGLSYRPHRCESTTRARTTLIALVPPVPPGHRLYPVEKEHGLRIYSRHRCFSTPQPAFFHR